VGYAGGITEQPTYEAVCSGTTGHAEVVEIVYDADEVDYETLLDVFFDNHNPTQLNRQGPDIGTQYRSAIFALTGEQRDIAAAKIAELDPSGRFPLTIATTIEPAANFWRAEEYHQQYLIKPRRGQLPAGLTGTREVLS